MSFTIKADQLLLRQGYKLAEWENESTQQLKLGKDVRTFSVTNTSVVFSKGSWKEHDGKSEC